MTNILYFPKPLTGRELLQDERYLDSVADSFSEREQEMYRRYASLSDTEES